MPQVLMKMGIPLADIDKNHCADEGETDKEIANTKYENQAKCKDKTCLPDGEDIESSDENLSPGILEAETGWCVGLSAC